MRLRRLEFVVIGLTLAFAFFMGGFFTGRSWSAVNITPVATQNNESYSIRTASETTETTNRPETASQSNTQENTAPDSNSVQADTSISTPSGSESGQPAETIGAPKQGDGKININLASQSELTDLPGIGAVLASRIIDYRRQNGDFLRIEDIRNVSGIGEKRYEAIQDKITIGS